ncbi:hypothetical protein ABB28_16160 [Stenotrophomonas chelatiphaga]|uniref:GtrA/DPMS transmembrane domain-containing protein n=2 Tax=Stenotrophomonas chelatiphaga TaxID=517011 RepID=A0A0R0CT11_9GAMM|nr:hypothetical protein ABB28_16160 [Stenotrophomonas chelatiphaga]ROQ45938.1 GtrA-like protein [Stenotrophomonas maltophilia]
MMSAGLHGNKMINAFKSRRGVIKESVGYLAASGLALAADLSIFMLLSYAGFGWYSAAAVGFLIGSVCAYWISVRYVFSSRCLHSASVEMAVFVLIGCFGLLIVQASMWIGIEVLGMPPIVARLIAVGGSFTSNFMLRKMVLFRSARTSHVIGEKGAV